MIDRCIVVYKKKSYLLLFIYLIQYKALSISCSALPFLIQIIALFYL
jgi:hypothetical protein